MTKIEKALENTEVVKQILKRDYCPAFFGLENNCDMSRNCENCWNQEVGE